MRPPEHGVEGRGRPARIRAPAPQLIRGLRGPKHVEGAAIENVVDRIFTAPPGSPGQHVRRDGRGERRREVSRKDRLPARSRSTTSRPPRARAQGHEKLVQLLECLAHRIRCPGAGSVESFLRGIEFV